MRAEDSSKWLQHQLQGGRHSLVKGIMVPALLCPIRLFSPPSISIASSIQLCYSGKSYSGEGKSGEKVLFVLSAAATPTSTSPQSCCFTPLDTNTPITGVQRDSAISRYQGCTQLKLIKGVQRILKTDTCDFGSHLNIEEKTLTS